MVCNKSKVRGKRQIYNWKLVIVRQEEAKQPTEKVNLAINNTENEECILLLFFSF